MAYQQVGTPRFFCNVLEWGILNDVFSSHIRLFTTLPVEPDEFDPFVVMADSGEFPQIDDMLINPAIFILGHKLNYEGSVLNMQGLEPTNDFNVNFSTSTPPLYDGWSLVSLSHDPSKDLKFKFTDPFTGESAWSQFGHTETTVASIVLSNYYTMPHSPDLNLSLSYDYSGVKEITTRGGASLSNTFYNKPAMWGDLGAWELHKPFTTDVEETLEVDESGDVIPKANQNLSRSGRRIWDLSFSYLSQEDTFPKYDKLTTLETGADQPSDYAGETANSRVNILPSSDDFYSQVIHRTNGGQLPFIFQPNSTDYTNFAIAKIDSDFTFEQVANGVYNVKMKIREVW